jgi:hypothetical protein
MVASERDISSKTDSRRSIIIIVAIIAAVAIASIFYLLMRAGGSSNSGGPTRLEGAIRPGAPEWEKSKLITLDAPEADEAGRALGDIVMTLHTTARNFTGRTLNGLEIRAAVVDHQGQPVKERFIVVVPTRQPELDPNRTLIVNIVLDGMTDKDDRANIKMEVTGFKFK